MTRTHWAATSVGVAVLFTLIASPSYAADAAKFTNVTAISPDDDTPVRLHAEATGEGLTFVLPKLGIYSIITIEK